MQSEGSRSSAMSMNDRSQASPRKKIWIDLDNSPHVPFFAPIIEELEKNGYAVVLTARDAYQVYELADLFHLTYKRVGRHYGKNTILKVLGTCMRSLQLYPFAAREKPDLAIAHGSRSQVLTSTLSGIPSLSILDYEFVNTVVRPTWWMIPEVLPSVANQSNSHRVLRYPGIKEDVYVPNFRSNSAITSELGLSEADVIVTVRPPASEAHYHSPESDRLFSSTIEFLSEQSASKVIVLPRNSKQAACVRESWPALFANGKIIIPDHAVDGLNLIWHSDMVISGGGTMNREAAALGVPVYSIFRGALGAVDRYLASHGRLVMIEKVEDLRTKIVFERRSKHVTDGPTRSTALTAIVEQIISLVESKSASVGENLGRAYLPQEEQTGSAEISQGAATLDKA